MELHAYTRTISDLFSVKKKYVVPRFQREYSWTKEKVSELWDDIISNFSEENTGQFKHQEYFIGSLVLVGNDKSVSMQIVDGQQRLTTLTILLSALCQRFREIDRENISQSIYENYIAGKDDDGNEYFKLENENPKPFFQTTIQHIEKEKKDPSSKEEECLLSSYNQFYNSTSRKSLEQKFGKSKVNDTLYENLLKAIRDQVVNYLKVIFITVNEEDEAYTIFETLNARGMDLSFVDLIKNKVFKSFNTTHPDDFAKTKWKELRKTIGSRDGVGSLETFVRHWWISRYNYTSADNLYKHFKKKWNSNEITPQTFLTDLVADAALYIKLSSPIEDDFKQQEEKDVYRSLVSLKNFAVSQQRPFILVLLKARQEKKLTLSEIKDTLRFIEQFHFSFNAICSERPSGIDGSYSKAARQLFNAPNKQTARAVINDLEDIFRTRLPDRSMFVEGFSKLKFCREFTKDKKIIQYIFSCIESSKQKTNEFKPDSITLEHIIPQSASSAPFVSSIGNLLPLGRDLNQEAGAKALADKIAIYRRSNFWLTNDFSVKHAPNWDLDKIEQRTTWLANYCYDIMFQPITL